MTATAAASSVIWKGYPLSIVVLANEHLTAEIAHDPGQRQFMRLHAVWLTYQYPDTLDPVPSPPSLVGRSHQAAERCFTTLKVGNEDPHQDLWAGARERQLSILYVQSNRPGSAGFPTWSAFTWGVTAEGHAFVEARADFPNVPTQGDGPPTGIGLTDVIRWELRDGERFVRRTDRTETSKWPRFFEMSQFARVRHCTTGWVLRHHQAGDNTDTAGWSGAATAALSADRMVGASSWRLTIPAGSAGLDLVYTLAAAEDWSFDELFAMWIKPLDGETRDDILQLWIETEAGVRTDIGRRISLVLTETLKAAKDGHAPAGAWAQRFVDMAGVQRGAIRKWGFRVLSDEGCQFLLNDAWVYALRPFAMPETDVNESFYPMPSWPDGWLDGAANPDADPDQDVVVDMTANCGKAFAMHESLDAANGLVRGAGVAIAAPYTQAEVVRRLVFEDTEQGVIYKFNTITHSIRFRSWDLLQQTFEAIYVFVPWDHGWTIVETTDPDTMVTTYQYQAAPEAKQVALTWGAIQDIVAAWDVPDFVPSADDLPLVSPHRAVLQQKPGGQYDTLEWVRAQMERLRTVGGTLLQSPGARAIAYKDPKGPTRGGSRWRNTVLDTRLDFIQLTSDICGAAGVPLIIENVIAVGEGNHELPHHNRKHWATEKYGQLSDRLQFVYADANGNIFVRLVYVDKIQPSDHEPQTRYGITYHLDYTYPTHRVSLASGYAHAEWLDGEQTIHEIRLDQLAYVLSHYRIQGVIFSEDTIHYKDSYGPYDLALYNRWRQSVRSPALPTLADFERIDNGQPVGPDNQYDVDDPDLWGWKSWLIGSAMQELTDVCHAHGALAILAVNLDSTFPVDNPASPAYDPAYFYVDEEGRTWTREFALGGARNGTRWWDMLKIVDLIDTWNYGNYSPWGHVGNYRDLLDFWETDRGGLYRGRLLWGNGLYPSFALPTGQELQEAGLLSAQRGYAIHTPGGLQLDQLSLDHVYGFYRTAQAVPPAALQPGDVVDCPYDKGLFCAKAGSVTLTTPAGVRVVHLARDMTVKADFDPYVSGTAIAIAAGDSLAVFTGQAIAIDPAAPVRFIAGW